MRRSLLLIPLAVVLAGAFLVNVPIVALLVAPVLVVTLLWGQLKSARRSADREWRPPAESAASTTDATFQPAGHREIVRALGRVEGRRLFLSPAFGAGLGFCLLIFVLFTFAFGGENWEPWSENLQFFPWYVHPIVGLTVLAAHRAVTRGTRDGAQEVFDTCPTTESTRTVGHLASAWMPVVVALVFLLLMAVGTAMASEFVHGPINRDDLFDVITALLLPAGGVALGVALGRWLPFAIVPVIAVAGIAFATTSINAVGGRAWNPYVEFSTAPTTEGPSPIFSDRPAGFHLVWILGLIGLVAVIALLHSRRDRLVRASGAFAGFLLILGAVGVLRPMPDEIGRHIADLIAHPEAHQDCTDVTAQVRLCVYKHHAALLRPIAATIRPAANALPAAAGTFTIRQRYLDRVENLEPNVRTQLSAIVPVSRPASEIAFGDLSEVGQDQFSSSLALSLGAVGLPNRTSRDLLPRVVAGQARGVVALWVAAQAVDSAKRTSELRAENPGSADSFERGTLGEIGMCSVPAVVWSAQDLAAARAIIALTSARVRATLESSWTRWTDPSTGTDELLVALGLEPQGPHDLVRPRPGSPC